MHIVSSFFKYMKSFNFLFLLLVLFVFVACKKQQISEPRVQFTSPNADTYARGSRVSIDVNINDDQELLKVKWFMLGPNKDTILWQREQTLGGKKSYRVSESYNHSDLYFVTGVFEFHLLITNRYKETHHSISYTIDGEANVVIKDGGVLVYDQPINSNGKVLYQYTYYDRGGGMGRQRIFYDMPLQNSESVGRSIFFTYNSKFYFMPDFRKDEKVELTELVGKKMDKFYQGEDMFVITGDSKKSIYRYSSSGKYLNEIVPTYSQFTSLCQVGDTLFLTENQSGFYYLTGYNIETGARLINIRLIPERPLNLFSFNSSQEICLLYRNSSWSDDHFFRVYSVNSQSYKDYGYRFRSYSIMNLGFFGPLKNRNEMIVSTSTGFHLINKDYSVQSIPVQLPEIRFTDISHYDFSYDKNMLLVYDKRSGRYNAIDIVKQKIVNSGVSTSTGNQKPLLVN